MNTDTARQFGLEPRYTRGIQSSGLLRSVCWDLSTDVSGQPIDSVSRGPAVQQERLPTFLNGLSPPSSALN